MHSLQLLASLKSLSVKTNRSGMQNTNVGDGRPPRPEVELPKVTSIPCCELISVA
jgi:hypothetical protein